MVRVLKVHFVNGSPVEMGAWSRFLEIQNLLGLLRGNLVVKSDQPRRIRKRNVNFLPVDNKLKKGKMERKY